MGGNAPGTINGLAGPFAATANLVYYLTIDDAVVLLDPNSTLDERLISGFFLIPTPGKFAKPFLKHADDAGGSSNIVRKGSKNEGDLNKDQTVNNKSGSKSIPKLTRDGRLRHNPHTPGKQPGDHAGHIAGDRFGGSPELDNLVSQLSGVNLSQYKKIEEKWASALKQGKEVKVNVNIHYDGARMRPSEFKIEYDIDGQLYDALIKN